MHAFNPHVISAILNEPWAIHEKSVQDYAVTVANMLNRDTAFEKGEPVLPQIMSVSAGPRAVDISGSQQNSTINISVINISGTLTKSDQFCGPAGMKSIGAWIQNADKDPAIAGILLVIDSPGGTVAGTEELANVVKATKKPVVAFVDDLAASAAYWIASAADEIIANNTTAQIGSVGVLMSFVDMQPALELLGYKFHVVTAPQSIDKVKMWQQLRSGNYEEYKETVLKPLATKFIDTVKENRPSVKDDQLTAAVYFAKDVVGSLIDSIGTFDSALQRTADLTLSANFESPNTNKSQSMSKLELKRLAKASGVETLESADGSITLTADQAAAVEAALAAHETANADLQSKVTDSSTSAARVTELEGQLQTANDKIAELNKGAGAESATITKDTDGNDESNNDSFYARFNKLKNQ